MIMVYQKILNLSGNTPNQLCKFRTKNWVEKNDNAGGTYNTYSQIGFKTSMLKWSLRDYNDVYILEGGIITVTTQAGDNPNNNCKEVALKIELHLLIA